MVVGEASKPTLRADAARNRERVLECARDEIRSGNFELQLNDVARKTGLGVGTVYRHFSTPKALFEAAVRGELESLVDAVGQALEIDDTALAVESLLRATLTIQLASEGALGRVLVDNENADGDIISLKVQLATKTAKLLRKAHRDKAVIRSVSAADVISLMCGLEYAVGAGHSDDPGRVERYLQVVVRGLRPE